MKIKSMMILAVISLMVLVGCSTNEIKADKDIPIKRMHGTFVIDPNNVNEVVGNADFIFVAYINKEKETVYKNPVQMETENGSKEVSTPYTNYSITVIDNIKGNLKKNNEIMIQKHGGLNKEKTEYFVFENDELLSVDKYYIISAYAQPDGSLLIAGPNSNLKLDYANKSDIMSSSEYKKYKDAVKNEVKTNRKRFKSIYE